MIRRKGFGILAVVALLMGLLAPVAKADDPACTPTGFVRDNINLTAKVVNPAETVTGEVNATGCDIGVYFGAGSTGTVDSANIYGARYFGVVNDGSTVDISGSEVHHIGENPFNGAQHGNAIYFFGKGATGHIDGNYVHDYQKGGIIVNFGSAAITHNTVTGLGEVGFIAQNGIQIGWGGTGTIANNIVTKNWYAGDYWSSTGILIYTGANVKVVNNKVDESQVGIYLEECTNCKVIANSVTNAGGDAGGSWAIYVDASAPDAKVHANATPE